METEYRKALECDPKQIESMILLGELQFDRVYSATGTEHFCWLHEAQSSLLSAQTSDRKSSSCY